MSIAAPNRDRIERRETRTTQSGSATPHWVHFAAGGAGGSLGALLTSPLEVVKTQSQTWHNRKVLLEGKNRFTPAVFHAIYVLHTNEGWRGLFKGLLPNLVGVFPSRAIYFGIYSATKNLLLGWHYQDNWTVHLLSAMAAGGTVSTVTSPIWLVKTRMQLQNTDSALITGHKNYKNSFDCVIRVLREEGVRGFYKGLGASYLGIAESSIQFIIYEQMKSYFLERKRQHHGVSGPGPVTLSNWEYVCYAACAKLIAAVTAYPHEVLRTRMREQRPLPGEPKKYTGLFQALRLILKEEGIKGWYGGMSMHLWRVVPNAAIMFWTYEMVVRFLTPS